ncbi:hypothetical protein [Actinocrispum sp. NPDC049592]|uniref:hypothetical protein n=1 Tax=Actinocrispum sp. NPDC049592 TaxID=3154835 RepID=UPI0034183052
MDGQPRHHHYRFAHVSLPRIALGGTVNLRQFADEGKLGQMLRGFWDFVGTQQVAEEDRLPADGLSSETVTTGDSTVLLITLPRALKATEAYFVAIAYRAAAAIPRYFCLEHGTPLFPDTTMIGEWVQGEGGLSHVNLGDGPEPDADAFLDAITRLSATTVSEQN